MIISFNQLEGPYIQIFHITSTGEALNWGVKLQEIQFKQKSLQ